MGKNYPQIRKEFQKNSGELAKKIPEVMEGFQKIHKTNKKDTALSYKAKELISLGIAISLRCDGCIAAHTHDCIEAGASDDEIYETIGVAILMGGGPSVVYGAEALDALAQFNEN